MRDQVGDAYRKFGRSFRRVVSRLVEMNIPRERISRDLATIADLPDEVGEQVCNAVARRQNGGASDGPDAVELAAMRKRIHEVEKDL